MMPSRARNQTSHEEKFEKLWNLLFWINGLQVTDKVWLDGTRARCILVSINTTLHIVTAVHYSLAVVYGIDAYLKSTNLRAYISFLNGFSSAFVSICTTLILQYRKEKFIFVYKKLALSRDTHFLKSLYQTTSIHLFLLFLVPIFTATSITIGYNRTVASNYTIVLMFGLDSRSEWFHYAKILTYCQFLFILLFAKYSVDTMFVYFIHICRKIARQFRVLDLKLQFAMGNGRYLGVDDLNKLRQRHQQICQLTDQVNKLFSPLIVVWLMGLSANLCFDLRAFKMQVAVFYNIFYGVRILGEIGVLVLLFRAATEVHTQAHCMNERLLTSTVIWRGKNEHCFDAQNHYDLNYILFCQRLACTGIGITASGLFLLNASSFLTMSASVLTYVIVLYQTS